MKKCFTALGIIVLLMLLILGGIPHENQAQAQELKAGGRVGGMLALQVEAKLRALADVPLGEGQVAILKGIQVVGARVADPNTQKVFIHFSEFPSEKQVAELD